MIIQQEEKTHNKAFIDIQIANQTSQKGVEGQRAELPEARQLSLLKMNFHNSKWKSRFVNGRTMKRNPDLWVVIICRENMSESKFGNRLKWDKMWMRTEVLQQKVQIPLSATSGTKGLNEKYWICTVLRMEPPSGVTVFPGWIPINGCNHIITKSQNQEAPSGNAISSDSSAEETSLNHWGDSRRNKKRTGASPSSSHKSWGFGGTERGTVGLLAAPPTGVERTGHVCLWIWRGWGVTGLKGTFSAALEGFGTGGAHGRVWQGVNDLGLGNDLDPVTPWVTGVWSCKVGRMKSWGENFDTVTHFSWLWFSDCLR